MGTRQRFRLLQGRVETNTMKQYLLKNHLNKSHIICGLEANVKIESQHIHVGQISKEGRKSKEK